MSKNTLLRQVYWPSDSELMVAGKVQRLTDLIRGRTHTIEVEVKRHQKKRSPEANAFLWGVCYPLMADASGYEKEEIHYAMCCKHFGTKVIEIMGQKFERPVRTTTTNEDGEAEWLGSGDFAEFTDFVIREAADWYDVAIPPPTQKEVPRDGR